MKLPSVALAIDFGALSNITIWLGVYDSSMHSLTCSNLCAKLSIELFKGGWIVSYPGGGEESKV